MLLAVSLALALAAPPADTSQPPPPRGQSVAAPQPRPRRLKVAVSELEAGLRADPKLSHVVTTLLTADLRRRPALNVTSQEDIKALLGFERQKALLGCAETTCLAEIGGALGVDQMVTGSLSRVGESLLLVVRLVDVHKGHALREVTRRFSGASEDALIDAIPGVATELYPNALPTVAPAAISSGGEVHAQPSAGRSNAPWWLVGIGAVVAAAGVGLTAYEFASKETPTQAGAVSTYALSLQAAQSANNVAYVGEAALGVGAALLVSGGAWALFRAPAPAEAAP